MKKEKVLVGFSGGIDSTMAIEYLKQEGYRPLAVFLQFFTNEDLARIKTACRKINVELITKNVQEDFQREVIDYFFNEYKNNRTPNPCVVCNPLIKFKHLIQIAKEQGIEKVATGHYARIQEKNEEFRLLKGVDREKDQSYFLYRLKQDQLARIIFPLGEKKKNEIKKYAEKIGIKPVQKGESQDVCFFSKNEKLKNFLKESGKINFTKGEIIDESGEKIGRHPGVSFFTQGQRKGLNIGSDGPYYVIRKEVERNQLITTNNSKHPDLLNKIINIENCNWIGEEPQSTAIYDVKSRYRASLSRASIKQFSDGKYQLKLKESQWAVAPGQSLVIYDKERVLGGGVII